LVCFKDENSCDDASNGDVTSFHQTRLGFQFEFWFDRFRTLVEIGGSTNFPHTFLEVCPAHKDKVEISAWASLVGKHQQNQNFTCSSLSLGTLNKMKLMLFALFNYSMGDKIKRLSMNIAFKYICTKGLSFLTYGRIVHKILIFA
jgi:hypothetical protein